MREKIWVTGVQSVAENLQPGQKKLLLEQVINDEQSESKIRAKVFFCVQFVMRHSVSNRLLAYKRRNHNHKLNNFNWPKIANYNFFKIAPSVNTNLDKKYLSKPNYEKKLF